jgi:hypothetical protein
MNFTSFFRSHSLDSGLETVTEVVDRVIWIGGAVWVWVGFASEMGIFIVEKEGGMLDIVKLWFDEVSKPSFSLFFQDVVGQIRQEQPSNDFVLQKIHTGSIFSFVELDKEVKTCIFGHDLDGVILGGLWGQSYMVLAFLIGTDLHRVLIGMLLKTEYFFDGWRSKPMLRFHGIRNTENHCFFLIVFDISIFSKVIVHRLKLEFG